MRTPNKALDVLLNIDLEHLEQVCLGLSLAVRHWRLLWKIVFLMRSARLLTIASWKKNLANWVEELINTWWKANYATRRMERYTDGRDAIDNTTDQYAAQARRSDALVAMYLEYLNKAGLGLDLDIYKLDQCESRQEIQEIIYERAGTKTA